MITIKLEINCSETECGDCDQCRPLDEENEMSCDIFGEIEWIVSKDKPIRGLRCEQCLTAQEERERDE